MQWLVQGGIFMIPLVICSILTLAVAAERLIFFTRTMRTALIDHADPENLVKALRHRMMTLHTMISIAPMLGLLGTVTGLMKSFYLLGNAVGQYRPQSISLGISEALITTASGLVIAVVATIFYNYFLARLEEYIADYNQALAKEEK